MAELAASYQITGALSVPTGISGELSGAGEVTGAITIAANTAIDIYDGDYEVRPRPFADTVLDTGGKHMREDVTIYEIPYYTTTNPQGGYTAIIGE